MVLNFELDQDELATSGQDVNTDDEDLDNELDLDGLDEEVDVEEDDSEDKDKVKSNLSKAVKEKNAEIKRLKEQLAERNSSTSTKSYVPMYDKSEVVAPPAQNLELINFKLKEYADFFNSRAAEHMRVNNEAEFNAHREQERDLKAELPFIRQQEREYRDFTRNLRREVIKNIKEKHPILDEESAAYVLDTAKCGPGISDEDAIAKSCKKYIEMLKRDSSKLNTKNGTKTRIASLNGGTTKNVTESMGMSDKVRKAAAILKKNGDLEAAKQRASYLGKTLTEYLKDKADRILKQ